ncbi:MAG: UDP-3-O-(3-hydroxymyristoyl)glucosamine N-acyltransferase [Acidobacteria bacterium]|nr:MAG: UDP-3-O-(3-hydroxymyristoyl)glucosamine N-acyltransferase [Acidobacteriota bacterium]
MKARDIAELVGGELRGDGDIEIDSVADLLTATYAQIAFVEKPNTEITTDASCLFVPPGFDTSSIPLKNLVIVTNPKLAFVRVAGILHPLKYRSAEIHPSAVVSDSATLEDDVFVGAFTCIGEESAIGEGTQIRAGAKIGDGVTVGRNCVIHPNVFIEDGCSIGDNVVLHAGVVIGADGFGYVKDESGEYNKFPQIGTVVIEDNVEIGANTCVDRGALGETRIGAGTKIDNLVQIGHNVRIGKRCVIAAQTGISGSTVIEDDCVIGGQVGFGDHAHVKSGAIIGSQAGVLPGKIVRPGVWWGTPIQPLDEYKRQNAHVKGLERLKAEVKELKKKLADG